MYKIFDFVAYILSEQFQKLVASLLHKNYALGLVKMKISQYKPDKNAFSLPTKWGVYKTFDFAAFKLRVLLEIEQNCTKTKHLD